MPPHRLPLVAALVVAGLGAACSHGASRVEPRLEVTPIPAPVAARPTLRYPVVLVHGMLAGPGLAPFRGVRAELREAGVAAFEPGLPALASIERRGRRLARAVDEALEETQAEKVHLVAHSMGGLDARYLVAALGYGDRVASITTIATPHRGADAADGARRFLGPTALDLVSSLTAGIGSGLFGIRDEVSWYDALSDLSPAAMREFNNRYVDDPRVAYQSFAGLAAEDDAVPARALEACGTIWGDDRLRLDPEMEAEELDDGVVAVRSARWGAFRGCLLADHGDQIGLYRVGGIEGEREFDHLGFYRWLASDLARLEGEEAPRRGGCEGREERECSAAGGSAEGGAEIGLPKTAPTAPSR